MIPTIIAIAVAVAVVWYVHSIGKPLRDAEEKWQREFRAKYPDEPIFPR